MEHKLMTVHNAAAWGARLSEVDYVPAIASTLQHECLETLSKWITCGEMPGKLAIFDTEEAMIHAASTAARSSVRVLTAATRTLLTYGMDLLYKQAEWRIPMVLLNLPGKPVTSSQPEPMYGDMPVPGNNGFLQIQCATSQEVLDTVIFACRLSEHEDVRLPVLINLEDMIPADAPQPVDLPNPTSVIQFVGSMHKHDRLPYSSRPRFRSVAVPGSSSYSSFRYELHLATQQALTVYTDLSNEFRDFFGREFPAIDSYCCEDADYVFVMTGAIATQVKQAVDHLRIAGWRVGLMRPWLLRPFPHAEFARLLKGKKAVAVIDQYFALGKGGSLYAELACALYGKPESPAVLASFVADLAGRDITLGECLEIVTELRKSLDTGVSPQPRLVFMPQKTYAATHS